FRHAEDVAHRLLDRALEGIGEFSRQRRAAGQHQPQAEDIGIDGYRDQYAQHRRHGADGGDALTLDLLPDRVGYGAIADAESGLIQDLAAGVEYRQAVDEGTGDMEQRKAVDQHVVGPEVVHQRGGASDKGLVLPGMQRELRRTRGAARMEERGD